MRLSERISRHYPRAFSFVVAYGLYLEAAFFNLFLQHGKHIIAVLKDERRDLMEDAKGLFVHEEPQVEIEGKTTRLVWDIEGFTTWQSLGSEVKVVRSLEMTTVRRQRTGKEEVETSEWIWATTLSQEEANAKTIIKLGHSRWLVENRALNEMVTFWHADYAYRHHPKAIPAFWLTLMLVLNLFRSFLNIKQCLRSRHSNLYFARLIFAVLYEGNYQKVPP